LAKNLAMDSILTRIKKCLSIIVVIFFNFSNGWTQTPIPGFAGRISDGAGGASINFPYSIFVSGNYAYVASYGGNALQIVDITNPTTPLPKGKLINGGSALLVQPNSVFVSGNYAYVASGGSNALEIVNVTDPANPVHAGSITDGTGGAALTAPNGVYVQGSYAYVVSRNSFSLEIVDVTNPAAPVHKGKIVGGLLGSPWAVFVKGNYAYVASKQSNALVIINVTDPTSPVIAGSIANGAGGALLNGPNAVFVVGNYAYVTSDGSQALEIVDVSNPAAPAHKGSITNGGAVILNMPRSLFVSGNYAYIPSWSTNALQIIDVTEPATPVPAASLANAVGGLSLNGPQTVFVSGNFAFIGSGQSMEVIAIFTPPPTIAQAANAVTDVSFNANWAAISNASGYFLDVSTDNFATFISGFNNSPQSGNSVSITGLTSATTFQYRVRATNANGTSANSNVITVSTSPATPTATAATSITAQGFTANWAAVAGATNYFIDVARDVAFTQLQINNSMVAGSATSLSVGSLTSGTTYFYRVRSANDTGSSPSSNVIFVVTVPAVPGPVTATAISQTSFSANWPAVTGATGYFVDVLDEANLPLGGYNNLSVSGTSLSVNNLLAGTTYKVVLRATNASGASVSSGPTPVLTIPPTPISGPADTNPTLTGFLAKWAFVKSATDYNITVATDPGFTLGSVLSAYSGKPVGNVNSLMLTSLAEKTRYYYKISATNASGTSPLSAAVSVTTAYNLSRDILFPTGGKLDDYRIISIPNGAVPSTTLSDESFQKNWRIMQYKNDQIGNEDVRNVTQLQSGKGYWINSNLNPAPAITLAGIVVLQATSLVLQPGWNQIGNPFDFSISWSDVLAQNSSVSGVAQIGDLYGYQISPSSGFKKYDGLLAFGGGFVNNSSTQNVQISISPDAKRFNGRAANGRSISGSNISLNEWFLPFTTKVGDVTNDLAGIGMHPEAKKEMDRFDEVALPRFFNYVDVSSHHPGATQSKWMIDVAPSCDRYDWTFSIQSNSKDRNANIQWDNSSWKNDTGHLFLFDAEANTLVDMKQHTEYAFELRTNRTLRFFYSAYENVVPDFTYVGDPYPNPTSGSVTIPFATHLQQEEVRLQLFDLTGTLVCVVASGQFAPGLHTATWDVMGDQRTQLPKGIYLYRFVSSAGVVRRGKIILQ
jgi:hypothetical protein